MITPAKNISRDEALQLYRDLLLPRLIEERMLKLLRQNRISKWFSGMGQEAIAVGVASTLPACDHILPMHRNLGVFTTRGVDLYTLFCQLLGKTDGFTGGRDRSFHFGTMQHNIVGMISHLAATMPVADGLALAGRLRGTDRVACSFCGDGATSEGEFHEALNLAGVWKLPVIFMIENNGYGLSTPTDEQYACERLVDRAEGYGLQGMYIDGNDVFEVRETISRARKLALKGKPVLIEAETFRMRGHEEASGTFYVPDELFEAWNEKDPVDRMRLWLLEEGLAGEEDLEELREETEKLFAPALEKALDAPEPEFDEERETGSVWAPWSPPAGSSTTNGSTSEKRFVDAIQFALRQAFEEDGERLIMGQDIAEYGGVFKVTEGFLELFGKERIRNTPIIEAGALGAAVGLALDGFKPVVEMQFADFISCGFNQLVNNISKSHYRWTPPLNITIRAPHGGGVGAGPFHSQSPEGWFMQHPGLKIVVPSTPVDAQNLLYSALHDPNPVLYFEHKRLYRSIRAETPDRCTLEPLGKARIAREGRDATVVTYGLGVHWALELAEEKKKEGVELEIVDLRCLAPVDMDTVAASVAKTHRVMLLQEPSMTLGPMSEVSACITESLFRELDAPVMRCSSLDMPVPFSPKLEEGYLASSRMRKTLEELLSY